MNISDRDIQHNISKSVIENNREGGLQYTSAGEVNPIVTIERNQFSNNGKKLYGNFSTCEAAIDMDIQNTQIVIFKVFFPREGKFFFVNTKFIISTIWYAIIREVYP